MDPHPSDLPNRRSIRLTGHDYSQTGAYFVTLCILSMRCLLGSVTDGKMTNSESGEIAAEEWRRSETLRTNIELDEFIVMPNHFHAIVWIKSKAAQQTEGNPGPKAGSLGSIIAQFKAATTRRINVMQGTPGVAIWQRNYFERIIRDEDELNKIRHYIQLNPYQWADDEYHR